MEMDMLKNNKALGHSFSPQLQYKLSGSIVEIIVSHGPLMVQDKTSTYFAKLKEEGPALAK